MNLPTNAPTAHLTDVEIAGHELHDRLLAEARASLAEAIEAGDLTEFLRAAV